MKGIKHIHPPHSACHALMSFFFSPPYTYSSPFSIHLCSLTRPLFLFQLLLPLSLSLDLCLSLPLSSMFGF